MPAVIVAERPRGGGGASRNGAECTLRMADGEERHCYLAWDGRAGDPSRLPYFQRETAILAALSGPLRDAGVRVAPLIAAFPEHLALLSGFVEGDDRFPRASDPAALAVDFIGQLAALHRVDASHPSLAELGDPAKPPSVLIRENLESLRARHLNANPDPILQLALDWLLANIPADSGPSVVLHGDAGPGNFLHKDNRVAALVDWELTHLGDPVEDLAQIWVRSLIQPFIPMRDAFRAYEAASGVQVELARVKFHRLYFQISFMVPGHIGQQSASAQQAAAATIGPGMIFSTMHRRVVVESLAELMGVELGAPNVPDCPPASGDAGYQAALDDLRDEIVPNIGSERASAKAKGLARLIKYWRMRDRFGAAFDAAELAELAHALARPPATIAEGRRAMAEALAGGRIAPETALRICHGRVARETRLMADALGALATTTYEKLDRD